MVRLLDVVDEEPIVDDAPTLVDGIVSNVEGTVDTLLGRLHAGPSPPPACRLGIRQPRTSSSASLKMTLGYSTSLDLSERDSEIMCCFISFATFPWVNCL